jgi:hypothetical protein
MNYILIEHESIESTNKLISFVDYQKCEIVIFNKNKVRGIRSSNKIHFLSFKKFNTFLKHIKPTDKLLLIDNAVGFIMEGSIYNIFSKHRLKQISIGCHTNGNNELYIAQVMGFIPDIVTKNWSDNYIDEADLNHTELEEELIFNLQFQLEQDNYRFLDFNKYQVFKINYKVRFLCISPKDLIFIFAKKHPYSLPEIIFKSILRKKKKYLISGAWVSENQQMYKTIDESERPFDSNIII